MSLNHYHLSRFMRKSENQSCPGTACVHCFRDETINVFVIRVIFQPKQKKKKHLRGSRQSLPKKVTLCTTTYIVYAITTEWIKYVYTNDGGETERESESDRGRKQQPQQQQPSILYKFMNHLLPQ